MFQIASPAGVDFRVRPGRERRAFWERLSAGSWEPQTFAVLRRFLHRTQSYIDIGAWIGPTALFAAHWARRVHAIEPDQVAYAELSANVMANPVLRERVSLHRLCVAPETGPVELYAGGMYHSSASAFGDSMSGMVASGDPQEQASRCVQGIRLVDFMAAHEIDDCGFIKMDVEGGEYLLIPGRWRELSAYGMPTLCVSFHAPEPASREGLIGDCLEELRACYRWVSAASEPGAAIMDLVAEVRDWGDDSEGSPWRVLEGVLGAGVVASNEER